jgi:glycosyltransferase involved in cell wall biosynthesis
VTSTALRIAILVDPFTLGRKWGAHAPELARELLGRGHTVRAFGAPPGAIPRSTPDAEGPEGGPVGLQGVAGFRPDAVLAYDMHSPAAWLGARSARRLDVPLVLVEPAGARPGLAPLRWLGRSLWGRYVRGATNALVALDPLARRGALADGFDPARVRVVPPGVDLMRYRPGLVSGLLGRHRIRGRILLYAGRMAEERGVDCLVRAFAQTLGQNPDWSLVLAGEGPQEAALRALVERLGVGTHVHQIARPREEELAGLFSASTLLAIPALDDSVRGLAVPLALACGLPVLASDRAALRELVEDGVHGLVVRAGDVESWARALQRAGVSPIARRRWSEAARARAEQRHAWPVVAEAFEALLRGGGSGAPLQARPSSQRSGRGGAAASA